MKRGQATYTKEGLIELLADYTVRSNPRLYFGHRDDAVYYWRHHGGTLADLLTAAVVRGLIPNDAARAFEGRRRKRS